MTKNKDTKKAPKKPVVSRELSRATLIMRNLRATDRELLGVAGVVTLDAKIALLRAIFGNKV